MAQARIIRTPQFKEAKANTALRALQGIIPQSLNLASLGEFSTWLEESPTRREDVLRAAQEFQDATEALMRIAMRPQSRHSANPDEALRTMLRGVLRNNGTAEFINSMVDIELRHPGAAMAAQWAIMTAHI